MAGIEKRTRDGHVVWRAHYRTPAGTQRNKTFTRKIDAERFLATVENAKNTGTFVDPALSRITVGEWAQRWLSGQTQLKPTTRERYEGVVRKYIQPTWSHIRLSAVSHADVQAWVTSLTITQSPSSVRKIYRVLSLMFDMAVKDGRLSRNVAAQINLPRPVKHERRYLTHAPVDALADACGYPVEVSKHRALDEHTNEMYRLVVLFLAYTGVRFGEMAALRVRRVDLFKRRAVIAESVTPVQGQGMVWGTTKTHQRREVPIPRSLIDDLARHIAGKEAEDLVFAGIRGGEALRVSTFRKAFRPAAERIGMPDLYLHELWHTAASLAIDPALPAVAPVLPEHDWHRNEKDLLASIAAGQEVFLSGTPNGIRTRATAVKGRRPRPLDDGGQAQ